MFSMLQYGFLQHAFLAGIMIAIIAPIVGVYLVLRRQSLMADTLSHVSLAGVAIGALIGVYPMITAMITALIGAVLVDSLRRSFRAYSELSIAILMSGGLATALVLMSLQRGATQGFTSYLFGSIIAVSKQDLLVMAVVLVLCLLFFWFLWRPMYVLTFDEETAQVSGVPTKLLSLCFSLLAGMVVAVAMPIVGVLLVSSLMVLPAAISLRISRGFGMTIAMAVFVGVVCVLAGLSASWSLNVPPGGAIVLLLLAVLIVVLVVKRLWRLVTSRASAKHDALNA